MQEETEVGAGTGGGGGGGALSDLLHATQSSLMSPKTFW